jgi:hypothetical protein
MEQKGGAKPSGFMGTSIGGKTIGEYIDIIKMPLMAMIGLSALNFLFGLTSYIPAIGFAFGMLSGLLGILIALVSWVIAGYIGYTTVQKYKGDLLNALAAGAIAGIISGLASAVLGILSAGIGMGFGSSVGSMIVLTAAFVGIIISPIVGAIIGGILAIIGGLIAGGRTFGPASSGQTAPKK